MSWAASLRSSSSTLAASWRFEARICRSRTKALTTSTLISTALGELRTDAAMTAPCSVKAVGGFRLPPQSDLEVANCDFKISNTLWKRLRKALKKCYLLPLTWYQPPRHTFASHVWPRSSGG